MKFTKDLIGKTIRHYEDKSGLPPMAGKVIAIDIHGRLITEYPELPDEIFADWELGEHLSFKKPKEIPEYIEKDGIKYKRVD